MMVGIIKKIFFRLHILKRPSKKTTSVGVLYLCTGSYEMFFEKFYKSFSRNFLSDSNKHFFVFTDSKRLRLKYAKHSNVTFIKIEHLGWPLGTLLRNKHFVENISIYENLDFLFFCNANLICKAPIYLDELGLANGYDLCGVQHPNYFKKKSTEFEVEKNMQCNALFTTDEITLIKYYFQGCFYGGHSKEFIRMINEINSWTVEDLEKNIMPIWFDESYLNKYFFKNPPYVLNPGYAYPEKYSIPFRKKIIQLDKVSRNNVFKHD